MEGKPRNSFAHGWSPIASHYIEVNLQPGESRDLIFPRDGKPVYIQVGSSENGAHIVYSIIAGNKLLEKGAWELGDLSAILIENINPLANMVRVPKKETALLSDFEVKRDRIAHVTVMRRTVTIG